MSTLMNTGTDDSGSSVSVNLSSSHGGFFVTCMLEYLAVFIACPTWHLCNLHVYS